MVMLDTFWLMTSSLGVREAAGTRNAHMECLGWQDRVLNQAKATLCSCLRALLMRLRRDA